MSFILKDYFYKICKHISYCGTMTETFTIKQIKDDPTMQRFLKKKSGSKSSTIDGYIYSIKDFCNATGKSPTEIYDLHRSDLINRVPEFNMWLNDALDDYVSNCINREKMYSAIYQNVSKIKGFFHAFKLKPTPKPYISKKRVREDAKYALTVEDIRKVIQHSKPTYQTLFITQAQTGLTVGDALLLDVNDFILAVSKKGEYLTVKEAIYRAKSKDNIIGCLDLRRKKTTAEFYTFIGPEALRSIAFLLESRDAKYLKPETPIFMKDVARMLKKPESLEDLRLNSKAVDNYTSRLHLRKGIFPRIEVDGKERNFFRTHKIRHWFSNQLRFKAGFNSDDVKYLMGQKTGDVLEYYLDLNNYNALKGNYRKALPYLAINDEIIMEENQEALEKLEKENQMLREQYEKDSKVKDEEIKKLKAEKDEEITQMNKKLARLEDIVNPETLKIANENAKKWESIFGEVNDAEMLRRLADMMEASDGWLKKKDKKKLN